MSPGSRRSPESRRRFRRDWSPHVEYSEFMYVASRAYNRVEGWSFVAGPRIQRPTSWGGLNIELVTA